MCVCDHHTMSWQSQKNIEGKSSSRGEGTTTSKIRKRGCSSSSSSSLVQRYRFKRAILVGKRGGGGGGGGGGSSTPVPAWKTNTKSPALAMPAPEQSKGSLTSHQCGVKAKEVSVSARKLAATLWEINKVPSPKDKQILSDPSYSPISEVGFFYSFFFFFKEYLSENFVDFFFLFKFCVTESCRKWIDLGAIVLHLGEEHQWGLNLICFK